LQAKRPQQTLSKKLSFYLFPVLYSLLPVRETTLKPAIPNSTITKTQNQIQSLIMPFTKSQLAKYKQNGLNPIILEGSDIIRFPKIASSSLNECAQHGLSEI
jgi:hypothetical protein